MDLFTQTDNTDRPLSDLLRPQNLQEFLGQESAWSKNSLLLKDIEAGHPPSLILWGPPGCGKTSLAKAISSYVKGHFLNKNAVDTGAKDIREMGLAAKNRKAMYQERTVVFIDEIHRLNKSQQDVLLPHVEVGDFTLIGATTENPSYALNSALLSRCKLVVFERLSEQALKGLLDKASRHFQIATEQFLSAEAIEALIEFADGDGRRLLNAAEEVHRAWIDFQQASPFSAEQLAEVLGDRGFLYDRQADSHYDIISAFIKSVRGSDPDAAVYYLARMLKGGEDPLFIARRLIILASEDVGNADPRALSVAVAGAQAVEMIGLPEGAITLAHVTTYLASAPKSNRSYEALQKANAAVEQHGTLQIPLHLRSSKKAEMKKLGYGVNYKYSHEGPTGWLPQDYLPEALKDAKFYEPTERGFEKNIVQYLQWMKGQAK